MATKGSQLVVDFVNRWPSLPFMALGVWKAWSSLAYSGAFWLSDGEVNGIPLSKMYVLSGIGCTAVFLLSALLPYRGRAFFSLSNRAVVAGGAVAGVGCLLIVVAGPYYFGLGLLFKIGALMSGMGTAIIGLRCGVLFGSVPPRRVLIYVGLSQLVAAFLYLAIMASPTWAPVPGGPSLVSTLAFCLLPIMAAFLSCMPLARDPEVSVCDAVDGYGPITSRFSGAFWGFVFSVFIMATATSMMRADVVATHDLTSTVQGNCALMLLSIFVAVAFVVYGTLSTAQPYTVGKLCCTLAVVSAMATVCTGAIEGFGLLASLFIQFCAHIFNLLIWSVLAFVVAQKHIPAALVFGLGWGMYMLGRTVGWTMGVCLSFLFSEAVPETVFFLAVAAVTLIVALRCFSERSYARLFSPTNEELSIDDLFDIERRIAETSPEGNREKRGRFSRAIEGLTAEHCLSIREAEVLRYLAMGYGGDRMAQTMGVKVNTVRAHTRNVYVKLGVHSRDELMKLVDDAVARM